MFFKFTAVQICIRDMYRALLINYCYGIELISIFVVASKYNFYQEKTKLRIKKIENANIVEELAETV